MSSLCTFPPRRTWLRIDPVSRAFPEFTRFFTPEFPLEAANFALASLAHSHALYQLSYRGVFDLNYSFSTRPDQMSGLARRVLSLRYLTTRLAQMLEASPIIVYVFLNFLENVFIFFFEQVFKTALGF